jgi:hypothetical protein
MRGRATLVMAFASGGRPRGLGTVMAAHLLPTPSRRAAQGGTDGACTAIDFQRPGTRQDAAWYP